MLHYMVIIHAFGLSTHNMVTYIYNLCTVSSIFYRYRQRERESACAWERERDLCGEVQWAAQWIFSIKIIILCAEQILNYWAK